MKRWDDSIDFEKYYGEKQYKKLQIDLERKVYTSVEKKQMIYKMIDIIKEKKFTLYHDFMDYISVNEVDCFNMITFNSKERKCILEYIKSKAISKYR